jgi:hypothetical protein
VSFPPILQRELRARARRPATYWTRFAAALIGLVVCLPYVVDAGGPGPRPVDGKALFDALVNAAFVVSCFACLLTAAAVDLEKREGTLGLLFLTRVKASDLLVGKLGSAGIFVLIGLLSLSPVFMLPVLAGGVTGGEALRKVFALLNTCFFALAAGLFFSVARQRGAKGVRTIVLCLGCLVLLPLIDELTRRSGPVLRPMTLGLLSPLASIIYATDTAYRKVPELFWVSLLSVNVVAWLLYLAASRGLGRSLLDDYQGQPVPSTAPLSGGGTATARSLPPEHEANPISWLVHRRREITKTLWAAAILSASYFLLNSFFARVMWPGSTAGWGATLPGLAVSIVIGCLLMWSTGRFFAEARRTGELELLLVTPQGANLVLQDHWRALKRLLIPPLLLMMAPNVAFIPIIWWNTVGPQWLYGSVYILLVIGNILLSVIAVCWVGMWIGLRARSQLATIIGAACILKLLPFLGGLILRGVLFNLFGTSVFVGPFAGVFVFGNLGPMFLGMLFNVWLIQFARRRTIEALTGGHPGSITMHRLLARAEA